MRRILVIRIDFLGDMVCTTPLLQALKTRWPQAEIHVLANKYNASVLDNNPAIARVHHYVYSKNYEKNIRPGFLNYLKDRVKLILTLRGMKFDLLVIPNGGMNKNAINFARQLNVADCRWHNADTEFDDRVEAHVATRPLLHEALSGFMLVPELGKPDIRQLRPYVFPCEKQSAYWQHYLGEKRKPRLGLFVSNKSAERRWPLQKWQLLSERFAENCEIIVVLSPQETLADEWQRNNSVRCITTQTVAGLIAAMTQLDIVISADSAPVHLASALQIPLVALFESRPEKYRRWHPLGVQSVLLHQGRQVSDIAVDAVCSAVTKLLEEISAASAAVQLQEQCLPPSVERSVAV
ncbi:glycosyltransferase family 9 protein [Erwinia sp. CGal63]